MAKLKMAEFTGEFYTCMIETFPLILKTRTLLLKVDLSLLLGRMGWTWLWWKTR